MLQKALTYIILNDRKDISVINFKQCQASFDSNRVQYKKICLNDMFYVKYM